MQIQGMILAVTLAAASQPAWSDTSAPPAAAQQGATLARQERGDGFDKPVTEARLAAWRGGMDVVDNTMKLQGTVAGNTANNVASGMNTISSGAFSNAAGLPVAIQNSGANVLIQNATIINLQLQ